MGGEVSNGLGCRSGRPCCGGCGVRQHRMMDAKTPSPQRLSIVVTIVAVVALVLAAVAVTLIVRHTGNRPTAAASSSAATSSSTTAGTPGTAEPPPTGATTRPPSVPPANDFGYQPLWPFEGVADAVAWQRAANPGGHQPWHLDAGLIAQMFTQQYLGFTNVSKVVKTDVRGDQAWVGVGFDNPNGAAVVAAVVHLVRIGTGDQQPWEVVGTEDSTLSLTTPAYGSSVTSPLRVGGRITGVDESLRVQVRKLDRQQPVGQVSGIPAGGTNTPWAATIPLTAACPGTLTIAVSTGGHIADVERFAITGAHC